jgi:hypothetical protein
MAAAIIGRGGEGVGLGVQGRACGSYVSKRRGHTEIERGAEFSVSSAAWLGMAKTRASRGERAGEIA